MEWQKEEDEEREGEGGKKTNILINRLVAIAQKTISY